MTIRRNIGRLAATTVVAGAVLTAGFAAPAFADDTNVTVTGGLLDITTPPAVDNFAPVTLNGTAQTTPATLGGFQVNDATGSGDGWKVTVQADQFTEHDGTDYVPSGRTLDTSSLIMAAPAVALAGDTTSPAPEITAGEYPIDAGSAVTIASAATGTGMGMYDFTESALTLSIPTDTYANTYRSTVTVSAVTGP